MFLLSYLVLFTSYFFYEISLSYSVTDTSCFLSTRLLKGVAGQDATFKRRYELMFVALASVAGDTLYQEFHKQEDLVKILTSVAEKVKNAKDKDVSMQFMV